MKVTLLAYTPNPADIAEIGAKTCYSEKSPLEIEPTEDKKTLKRAINSGHGSVLEHAVFTFGVEGVSRALTHQLVRHRVASFSQQSQRYVATDETNLKGQFILPESFATAFEAEGQNGKGFDKDGCLETTVNFFFSELEDLIRRARENGIPEEDIRYFYPNGLVTNIVITMNARELLHFFSLRCCTRAQWEIRELANSMLNICKEVCPEIFGEAGASCAQLGYCPEDKSCGKVKTLVEIKKGAN